MSRARRFHLICKLLAVFFLTAAVSRLVVGALPLADPLLSTAVVSCNPCTFEVDPVRLLQPEMRKQAWRTSGSDEALRRHVQLPRTRALHFLSKAVRAFPMAVLFLALAMALRALAEKGIDAGATAWLERASYAALVWAAAEPLSRSLNMTAFSAITHGKELVHVVISPGTFLPSAVFAISVWALSWALSEAVSLRLELDEFV